MLEKKKSFGVIYKATNKINGKSYIGQTVKSLEKRKNKHINDAKNNRYNMYFHKAIRKYGKEDFIWEIVAECNSLEELNMTEIKMIEKYNTLKKGYNLNVGGEGQFGFKHSKETKKKMSEANKGEKHPMYGKYGKNNPNFGKTRSEKSKKKMSEAQRGKRSHMYGRRGTKHFKAKKYIVITPEGEKIFIHGIRNFCKNYKKEKLYHTDLIKVAQGKYKQHKGYRCKRLYKDLIVVHERKIK